MDEVAALNTPTLITMVNDDDDLESTKRYIDEKYVYMINFKFYFNINILFVELNV